MNGCLFSLFLTVQTLVRESQVIREAKEKQIVELKKMCEQSADSLNNEWEKRVMNIMLCLKDSYSVSGIIILLFQKHKYNRKDVTFREIFLC